MAAQNPTNSLIFISKTAVFRRPSLLPSVEDCCPGLSSPFFIQSSSHQPSFKPSISSHQPFIPSVLPLIISSFISLSTHYLYLTICSPQSFLHLVLSPPLICILFLVSFSIPQKLDLPPYCSLLLLLPFTFLHSVLTVPDHGRSSISESIQMYI